MATTGYRLGEHEVRPGERRVLTADGSEAALGSRAFDLLLALIEHRERVIGKDELMALVWPGVVVEENNLTVQVSALRKLLGAQAVRTVAGRGYQLGLPVLPLVGEAAASAAPQVEAGRASDLLPLPDKPSIAVLPFTNLGGDPEQEYVADGITEDVITELARYHELFVIARNSSFTYKGRAVDVRAVGRELGVRYVLEGSVRRAGTRVRVAAQLVEAASGSHVWAERYDRELADIFALQEEVTRAIVGAMAPQIDVAEMARLERPGNLSAYELAMRARALLQASAIDPTARAAFDQGLTLAREALALDPACATAWRTIGHALCRRVWVSPGEAPDGALAEAEEACRRAIALDPNDHLAHCDAGFVAQFSGRFDEALVELRRAVELNPNDATALVSLAFVEAASGWAQPSIEHAELALRLSPRDPWRGLFVASHGMALFHAGRYADAADAARGAIAALPKYPPARLFLAASLVGLGDIADAREAFVQLQRLAPEYVASRLASLPMIAKPQLRHRLLTFVRIAAGLEPPAAAEGLR